MIFECPCGCEWESDDELDRFNATLKSCPLCKGEEDEDEEPEEDEEDSDQEIVKQVKKDHSRKKKYTDEFWELMEEQCKIKTLPEIRKLVQERFGFEFNDEQHLYRTLWLRGIKPQRLGPKKEESDNKSKEDISEVYDYIKGHTGTKSKRLVREIKDKFGVNITAQRIGMLKRKSGYVSPPKSTPEKGLDPKEALDGIEEIDEMLEE